MATKILYILILLFSKIGLSQNQFGFGISTGAGSLIFKKELNESPQNTFHAPLDFLNPQYKLEFFLKTKKKYIYNSSISHNNYALVTRDNSKNILFFPELKDGRGFKGFSGGRAKTFSFSLGKIYGKNKIHFIYSINTFVVKLTREYYSPIGLLRWSTLDGVKQYEYSFYPIGAPYYSNKMITFGVGLKSEFLYDFKNEKLKFKMSAEINKGFIKVREQSFRTQFISYVEPEKNATYYNTISTKGSNIQFYVGLVYFLKKKG